MMDHDEAKYGFRYRFCCEGFDGTGNIRVSVILETEGPVKRLHEVERKLVHYSF